MEATGQTYKIGYAAMKKYKQLKTSLKSWKYEASFTVLVWDFAVILEQLWL